MIVINDNINIQDFPAWSEAKRTQEKIIESGNADNFEALINELYPEGLTDVQLNDILWFEEDWIFKQLGIQEDDD